jgi:hypothetical protein
MPEPTPSIADALANIFLLHCAPRPWTHHLFVSRGRRPHTARPTGISQSFSIDTNTEVISGDPTTARALLTE